MSTDREQNIDVMRQTRVAILTYTDEQGRLVSAPMATQDFEDPSTVWFITQVDSDKVRAIQVSPAVNVAYAGDKGWVSLSGTARLNTDRARLKELWGAGAGAFLTGDADDPNNALLEVDADTAQLWESPGKLGLLVKVARGLTGGRAATEDEAPVVDL